ncbi:hypothetical protein UlMin_034264 [Ulmus minor]
MLDCFLFIHATSCYKFNNVHNILLSLQFSVHMHPSGMTQEEGFASTFDLQYFLLLNDFLLFGTSYENMTIIVQNYEDSLEPYPYWNRTLGADHFLVTCHDVGVRATEGLPLLVKNSIRVVCTPSYDVGFIPHKDVALPQSSCIFCSTILGFWAGHRNSKLRVILARVWENDTELYVLNNRINRATGSLTYQKTFYTTKLCICPGGSQVNSARITDSIHYGCIPVLRSMLCHLLCLNTCATFNSSSYFSIYLDFSFFNIFAFGLFHNEHVEHFFYVNHADHYLMHQVSSFLISYDQR